MVVFFQVFFCLESKNDADVLYNNKRGGGKAKIGGTHETKRIERTRGVELFCLDQRATPHVTHKTNEQTKKKKNKKKRMMGGGGGGKISPKETIQKAVVQRERG